MERKRLGNAAASLLLAAVMVLGVGLAAISAVPISHARSSHVSASAAARPNAATLARITQAIHPLSAVTRTTSGNWAGFVNTVSSSGYGSITEVESEWYVPAITCTHAPAKGSYQVSWIGIDGYRTSSVEQVGTFSYCATTGATPAYYDWWEFYPYNSIQTQDVIAANDLVDAYVLYNPTVCASGTCGAWTLELYDFDAGATVDVQGGNWVCSSATVCEGGSDGSAECISEAPASAGKVLPVADYGSTAFYECETQIGTGFHGIGSWTGTSGVSTIGLNQLGKSGKIDQLTGSLVSFGGSKSEFSLTWQHYA